MKLLMKKILLTAFLSYTTGTLFPVAKNSTEVFKKWLEWQEVRKDIDLSLYQQPFNKSFAAAFKENYEKDLYAFRKIYPILSFITNGQINEHGHQITSSMLPQFSENLLTIYTLIDRNMKGFVEYLKQTPFASLPPDEKALDDANIEKYSHLTNLIFSHDNKNFERDACFSAANRFFEYTTSQETFNDFLALFKSPLYHSIARFLYANIWHHLAGEGWKHWHETSLATLKELASQGKEIVYLAGGSDVLQLIKAGIRNIRIIDPQLPSQTKYYAEGWEFLIKGDSARYGIGDRIIFFEGENRLIMERTAFTEEGISFKAQTNAGKVLEIPKTKTVWTFYDADKNQTGTYTIERRLIHQNDFSTDPNKALLISFNELFFISLPDFLNGWGINTTALPDDISLVVKQLRRPITKQCLNNLRLATMVNTFDLKYLSLGTCIN